MSRKRLYLLKVMFIIIIIIIVIILLSSISISYQSPVKSGSHQEITEINPSTFTTDVCSVY